MPNGMFTADPYLAGREPSAATDLPSVCAMLEALHDLLSAGGEFSRGGAHGAHRGKRVCQCLCQG